MKYKKPKTWKHTIEHLRKTHRGFLDLIEKRIEQLAPSDEPSGSGWMRSQPNRKSALHAMTMAPPPTHQPAARRRGTAAWRERPTSCQGRTSTER